MEMELSEKETLEMPFQTAASNGEKKRGKIIEPIRVGEDRCDPQIQPQPILQDHDMGADILAL